MSAPLSSRMEMTRKRCSRSPGSSSKRNEKIRKGVGNDSAPKAMHFNNKKRLFTPRLNYVFKGLTASGRISTLRKRVRAMVLARFAPRRQKPCYRLAALGVLVLMLGSLVRAATPPDSSQDFADFLAQHQAELGAFFSAHFCDMLKGALPVLVSTAVRILLASALAGWLLDILLAWGFATIFAPAYAKFTRALIYACGRLVLALMLTIVLMFAAMVGINAGAGMPALFVVGVLTVPAIFAQVYWVSYMYRTGPRPSLLFYIALLAVHALVCTILVPTLFAREVDGTITASMSQGVVPVLRTEAEKERQQADLLAAKRDAAQAKVSEFEARIAQDVDDQKNLAAAIAAQKDSPAAVYSRLVLLHAQGNLLEAAKGISAFIVKYPNDPHTEMARGQLELVNQALAAQAEARRQQQARDAQAELAARRHVLQDAAAGQATLSELRTALLGKTTQQVAALFGAPSETGADKWGYGRRMVYDPDTHSRRGLTVIFADGVVQGVDYYYGDTQ